MSRKYKKMNIASCSECYNSELFKGNKGCMNLLFCHFLDRVVREDIFPDDCPMEDADVEGY